MNSEQKKSILALLVIGGILLGLCGMASNSQAAGGIDAQLVGTWVDVNTCKAALVLILNADGTFTEYIMYDGPVWYLAYLRKTIGRYEAQGDKLLFYGQRFSSTNGSYKRFVYAHEIDKLDNIKLENWKSCPNKVHTVRWVNRNMFKYDGWTVMRQK